MLLRIYDFLTPEKPKFSDNFKGVVSEVIRLKYTRRAYDVGSFELTVPANADNVDKLQPDRLILFGDDIFQRNISGETLSSLSSDALYITEIPDKNENTITITGYDLKYFFAQRLTLFPTEEQDKGTYGYYVTKGTTFECLSSLVRYNVTRCTDPDRVIYGMYNLVMPSTQISEGYTGIQDDGCMTRLEPLSSVFFDMLKNCKTHYYEIRIAMDYTDQPDGYVPRMESNEDKPTMVISEERYNINGYKRSTGTSAYKNAIYAVAGTDTNSAIVQLVKRPGDTARSAARKEAVVNIDVDSVADISKYALKEAKDYIAGDSFEFQPLFADNEESPQLAQKVAVKIGDEVWETIVTEITDEYTESGHKVTYTTGDKELKVINALSSAIAANTSKILNNKIAVSNNAGVGKYANAQRNSEIFNDYNGNSSVGEFNHIEGRSNKITGGDTNHVAGTGNTIAKGTANCAEGMSNNVNGGSANHVEGYGNTIEQDASFGHAEGNGNNMCNGNSSHVEGHANTVQGSYNHAEGMSNKLNGSTCHVNGQLNKVTGNYLTVSGQLNTVDGMANDVSGYYNTVGGSYNLIGGQENTLNCTGQGQANIGAGLRNKFTDGILYNSMFFGDSNSVSGNAQNDLIGGEYNRLSGYGSTVNGRDNTVSNSNYTLVHGQNNTVDDCDKVTVSGGWNKVSKVQSGAVFGHYNELKDSNPGALVAGEFNTASGEAVTVAGLYNEVSHSYNTVFGKFNIDKDLALCIGNGSGEKKRSNALELDWDGNLHITGKLIADGGGGSSVEISDVIWENSTNDTAAGSKAVYDFVTEQIADIPQPEIAETIDDSSTNDTAAGAAAVREYVKQHVTDNDNPHGVTKSQVGLGNVPNVTTNDQTPTYTEATENANLVSGEKLSTVFGKIAKAIKSLIAHLADKTIHITSAERTAWNAKAENTVMTGATSASAGKAGLVPAPEAGNQGYFLRGDGLWAKPTDNDTNTTYTLTKSGSTITLTGSDGKSTSVTDDNTAKAASTTTVGSASGWSAGALPTLGTAIPADDITAWSAGSLPTLGNAIAADDITAWSAGSLPTLGTAIAADDITAWSAGMAASASVSKGVLTITNGTAPSLSYTARSIPNVTGVGSLPSLTYTARSIPNVTGVGTLPSLTYTPKSIPNVTGVGALPSLTVTNTNVVTGVST